MLGGNIVVIDEGRVLQTGPTASVYHNPTSIKVAQIFSDPPINHLEGKIENNMAIIDENLKWPLKDSAKNLKPGKYFFGIRANHLFLSLREKRTVKIEGLVELSEINGSETFIHVSHAQKRIVVQESGIHSRKIGSNIAIYADPGSFFIFDEKGRLAASPSRNKKT
jgi:glycerol transport system ATP-binding protein